MLAPRPTNMEVLVRGLPIRLLILAVVAGAFFLVSSPPAAAEITCVECEGGGGGHWCDWGADEGHFDCEAFVEGCFVSGSCPL